MSTGNRRVTKMLEVCFNCLSFIIHIYFKKTILLVDWLLPKGVSPDVYAIGFQEIVDLTTGNVLLSADITNSNAWTNHIKNTIDKRTDHSYVLLKSRQVCWTQKKKKF